MKKFKVGSTETTRVGETNNYQVTTYNIEAETEDQAVTAARKLIPDEFRVFFVYEDVYGPNWVPMESL